MAKNYVEPIALAIQELNKNKYPLEYYMGFGWSSLEQYGLHNLLSQEQWDENDRLRKIVNQNSIFSNWKKFMKRLLGLD